MTLPSCRSGRRADDVTVRVIYEQTEIARHARSWQRHQAVEDAGHLEKLLERRKPAQGPKRKDRLAAMSPACRLYMQEVARSRLNLDNEVRKLRFEVELIKMGDTRIARVVEFSARDGFIKSLPSFGSWARVVVGWAAEEEAESVTVL